MFLLILESIGTPELIFIAIVALVVFGPRKLPQLAKTIGKTMEEFKNATNEFKSTWEKEVAFEEETKPTGEVNSLTENPSIARDISARDRTQVPTRDQFPAPQIKELTAEDIAQNFQGEVVPKEEIRSDVEKVEKTANDKRDWI